jgi:hypothetical protein
MCVEEGTDFYRYCPISRGSARQPGRQAGSVCSRAPCLKDGNVVGGGGGGGGEGGGGRGGG